MKSFFKRSAIGLAVLGMTGSAFAFSGFIGVEGLDLRPMNGDLDVYRLFTTTTTSSTNNFYSTNAISTDYNWAWRLYAGLRMNDDDVTISWLRWRSSQDRETSFVTGTGITNNVRYVGTNYTDIGGSVNFDLDEVYGVWGHTVHFNSPWCMRFAAGVEYAHLDSDLNTSGFNSTNTFANAESSSDLKGWGPRAEFDLAYQLPSNFMIFANSNAALLVSRREIGFDRLASATGTVTIDDESYSTRHVVVPKFGMRLGVGYTFPFGQVGGEGSMGSLTITAGWQVESYIHALERRGWDFNTSTPNVDDTKVSNFGDQGFFVGLTFSS